MPAQVFSCNGRAFCFWSEDPRQNSLEHLEQINADYFLEIADSLENQWQEREKDPTLLQQIVLQYFLSLEAFFSFLLSILFAPNYFYGWLVSYRNQDLHEIVAAIMSGEDCHFQVDVDGRGWEAIAATLFPTNDADWKLIVKNFGNLWRELARRFNDENELSAFNRAKHGFALKPDAILKVQTGDPKNGVTIGSTGIGHRFGVAVRMNEENKNNFRVDSRFVHWEPSKCLFAIRAVGMSLHNLYQSLRAHLLTGLTDAEFYVLDPTELNSFLVEQEGLLAVTLATQHITYSTPLPTKDEILDFLSKNSI